MKADTWVIMMEFEIVSRFFFSLSHYLIICMMF